MDVFNALLKGPDSSSNVKTVGMHTAGEPTRIIIQGFPMLIGGTLLQKRAYAKENHDDIRKKLMHEPRGHRDMYGAILVQDTELVRSGAAHVGVLFCHNEGFSTMCGHATLALGRFLVDTHDTTIFPNRELLPINDEELRVSLAIHAPCGAVQVSVPILPRTLQHENVRSDSSRSVWFLSVPSFSVAVDLILHIPQEYCWPNLLASDTNKVKVDLAFGGAFYAIVSVSALGFSGGDPLDVGLENGVYTISDLDKATALLKAYISDTPELRALLRHPTSPELEYLYGVTVIDPPSPLLIHKSGESPINSDVGLCFFADQQIDRSPTGSCVCARVALALSKEERGLEVPWIYHSMVTKRKGEGAFRGRAVQRVILDDNQHSEEQKREAWIVKVEGKAFYTDASAFVLEHGDGIGREGFVL